MPTINVTPRSRLGLQEIADVMARSKKVVVITGAGISTNCGIPDFRSENGLYSMIQAQYDAALLNPPWEHSNEDDIDDRPKKKRKVTERWFYELVTADGVVVARPDESSKDTSEEPEENKEARCHSSPGIFPAGADAAENKDELVSESSSIGEQPSEQLLKETIEYAAQYSLAPKTEDLNQNNCGVPGPPPKETLRSDFSSGSLPEINTTTKSLTTSNLRSPTTSHLSLSETAFENPSSINQSTEPSNLQPSPNDTLPLSSDQVSAISPAKSESQSSSRPSSRRSTRSHSTITSNNTQGTSVSRSSSINQKSRPQSSRAKSAVIEVVIPVRRSIATPPPIEPIPNPRRRALQREASSVISNSDSSESASNPSSQSSSSSRPSLPNLKGKDLFDSIIWSDPYSTSIFYMFITSFRKKINNDVKTTTETHRFIRALRDSGRLVRNYTQNIDSLEEREGLSTELSLGPGNKARFLAKNQQAKPSIVSGIDSPHDRGVECVLLHGSLVQLRCGLCSKLSNWDEANRESITGSGQAPDCPSCIEYNAHRKGRGRRGLAIGRLRPDIVLYGEEHPKANLVAPLITHDLALSPDVLLILGTSLRVHGLKIMVKEFAKAVHAKGGKVIFVNNTKPPESTWGDVIDYWVEWDCDKWVLDLKARRGEIWLPQGTTIDDSKYRRESINENNPDRRNEKKRPTAIRDDKQNAVHYTFKILDTLNKFRDTSGKPSPRPTYWPEVEKRPYRASTGQITSSKPPPRKMSQSRKSTSATTTITSKPNAKSKSKKRKPDPAISHDSTLNGMWFINSVWDNLRKQSGGALPERTFEELKKRMPLAKLCANLPSNTIGYRRSFDLNSSMNHFPTIKGIDWVPMGLVSYPPSGAPELMGKGKGKESGVTEKSKPTPTDAPEKERQRQAQAEENQREIAKHGYGTRSSRRLAAVASGDPMRIGAILAEGGAGQ